MINRDNFKMVFEIILINYYKLLIPELFLIIALMGDSQRNEDEEISEGNLLISTYFSNGVLLLNSLGNHVHFPYKTLFLISFAIRSKYIVQYFYRNRLLIYLSLKIQVRLV